MTSCICGGTPTPLSATENTSYSRRKHGKNIEFIGEVTAVASRTLVQFLVLLLSTGGWRVTDKVTLPPLRLNLTALFIKFIW